MRAESVFGSEDEGTIGWFGDRPGRPYARRQMWLSELKTLRACRETGAEAAVHPDRRLGRRVDVAREDRAVTNDSPARSERLRGREFRRCVNNRQKVSVGPLDVEREKCRNQRLKVKGAVRQTRAVSVLRRVTLR